MNIRFFVVVAGNMLSTVRTVRADEAGNRPFVEVAVSAGVSTGVHRSSALVPSLNGYPSRVFYLTEDIAGPATGVTITPGYAWSEVAVGVGMEALYVASLGTEQFHTPGALVYSASVVGLLRGAKPGLFGSVMLGVAGVRLRDMSAEGGFASFSQGGMSGPRVGFRLGHAWSSGLGFSTTLAYASLSNEDGAYGPLTLCAQATYSGW